MARHLFGPEVVWRKGPDVTFSSTTSPSLLLSPGQPFTAWSADSGGTEYTADLKARDGVTALTPAADSNGQEPYFFGPDNVHTVFVDAGGGLRYEKHAIDSTTDVLANGARLNVPQTWTAQQDFTTAPTVNGAPLGTGAGGGGTTFTAYSQVQALAGYPTVVAAGATPAEARAAIAAGTSNLALGATSSTAKAGNYSPSATEVNAVAPPPQIYWNNTTGAWAGPPRSTWAATIVVAYKASLYVGATMPAGVYAPLAGDEFYLHASSPLRA